MWPRRVSDVSGLLGSVVAARAVWVALNANVVCITEFEPEFRPNSRSGFAYLLRTMGARKRRVNGTV